MRKRIPSTKKIIEVADTPPEIENLFHYYDETDIIKNINEYYKNNSKMQPLEYEIQQDSQIIHTTTSQMGWPDGNPPQIENVTKTNSHFSEYNEDMLHSIGLDTSQHWNGDIAYAAYDNGNIYVGESDYYSMVSMQHLLIAEMVDLKDTPLRDRFLSDVGDFCNPYRPICPTAGGVMLADNGDEYVLIIGRRSDKVKVNRGMISIFPNGSVNYNDVSDKIFLDTVRREFQEEWFDDTPQGTLFHDKHVNPVHMITGWNLRDGALTTSYMLQLKSTLAYDVLSGLSKHNDEIDEVIEVPIKDGEKLSEILNLETMSGTVISTILESLMFIDENEELPDLPYNVTRIGCHSQG